VSQHAPPTEPPTEPPRGPEPVVVPRWIQLVVLPLARLGVWALARASGPVLLVFAVAAVVALGLNPVVEALAKPLRKIHLPRGLAVLLVYLALVLVLLGVGLLLVNAIANQVESFQRNLPNLVDQANKSLADLQKTLNDNGIKVEITSQGRTALQTLQDNLSQSTGDIVSSARDILGTVVEGAFGLVLTIVISIYMLLYGPRIGAFVRRVLPQGDGTPDDDFPRRAQKAVFNYVRGQVAFYASTRTYRPVLEAHGRGEIVDTLRRLVARGDYESMAREIDDGLLDALAVSGSSWDDVWRRIRERWDGLADRVSIYGRLDGEAAAAVARSFAATA